MPGPSITIEPLNAQFPSGGGTLKFRVKNSTTKRYMYQLHFSDVSLYTSDLDPTGLIHMGDSKNFNIIRTAAASKPDTLKLTYYECIMVGQNEIQAKGDAEGTVVVELK